MKTDAIQGWRLGNRLITGRLIVPSARERLGKKTRFLSADLASQLIVASGSQFFIVGTSTTCGMSSYAGDCQSGSLFELHEKTQLLLKQTGEERTFYTLINTSRSETSQQAVDRALMGFRIVEGHSIFGTTLIKFEVYDPGTHAPKDLEVAKAAEDLRQANPDLEIIPFINKDPDLAADLVRRFSCPAVRVFGSTIGNGLGLGDEKQLERVIDRIYPIPVIAEGGIGITTHVRRARELGAAACLVNTAIAEHPDPISFVRELRRASEFQG